MLVHEKSSSVVFVARNPQAIVSTIPKSKVIQYQGQKMVGVYHGVEETTVLRNLGYDVPSPILYRYPWPGRHKPYSHQKETAAFFVTHRRGFCFNGMGTGKTLSALWAADFLMREGLVRKVLIISPLSTVKTVWSDEIFWELTHRKSVILTGSAARRRNLLNSDADFFIINHDGVNVIKAELAAHKEIDLVIGDEAGVYRSSNAKSTQRYRALKHILTEQRRLWLLTATPCSNAPTDAWGLTRLVSPKRVPPYYGTFKRDTMLQVSQFKWIAKPEGMKIAFDAMQPAIRFATEDCIDLPPVTYTTRSCELSGEQTRAYEAMRKDMVMQAQGGPISAQNAAVQVIKLWQIACGAVRANDDGDVHMLDASPRLAVLDECIDEAPPNQKVIVFVQFRAALDAVVKHLRKTYTVEQIDGGVSATKRAEIFFNFQNTDTPRVLVSIPQTMSHGLNLTSASTVIWYSGVRSADTYEQANGRIARPAQKNHMSIIHLEGTPLERDIYKSLDSKIKMQETLLSLYKREISTHIV